MQADHDDAAEALGDGMEGLCGHEQRGGHKGTHDADGILEVTALEQETGARSDVVVKPAFGLSEGQITAMLKAGYEHAGEDMQARKLGEAQIEAEGLLAGLRAALAKDGDLLSDAELKDLEQSAAALEAAMAGNQPEAIREATESLGRATETFAARRMDRSIQAALQGVAITELESDQQQGDGQ